MIAAPLGESIKVLENRIDQEKGKRTFQVPQDSDSEEVHLVLDDWDKWFKSPEDSEVDCSDESNSDSDS